MAIDTSIIRLHESELGGAVLDKRITFTTCLILALRPM